VLKSSPGGSDPGRLHAKKQADNYLLSIRSGGLTHETTDHLRRGDDFHGIFHRGAMEIAGAGRKLTRNLIINKKEQAKELILKDC